MQLLRRVAKRRVPWLGGSWARGMSTFPTPRRLDTLETPCFVLDMDILTKNCLTMQQRLRQRGVHLRAEVHCHRTLKGALLQQSIVSPGERRVSIASLENATLFADAKAGFSDVLLSTPISESDVPAAARFVADHFGKSLSLRLLVDSAASVDALEAYAKANHVDGDISATGDAALAEPASSKHDYERKRAQFFAKYMGVFRKHPNFLKLAEDPELRDLYKNIKRPADGGFDPLAALESEGISKVMEKVMLNMSQEDLGSMMYDFQQVMEELDLTMLEVTQMFKDGPPSGDLIAAAMAGADPVSEQPQDQLARVPGFSVYVAVDTGYHRWGVDATSDKALELAMRIDRCKYLSLDGVYSHSGQTYACETPDQVKAVSVMEAHMLQDLVSKLGLERPLEVELGSTPAAVLGTDYAGATCVHAGHYVLMDRVLANLKCCTEEDIAGSVLTRVTSVCPEGRKLNVDAKLGSFSKDGYVAKCMGSLGSVRGHPSLVVTSLTDDGGVVEHEDGSPIGVPNLCEPGALLEILPNSSRQTSLCHDSFFVMQDGAIISEWEPTSV